MLSFNCMRRVFPRAAALNTQGAVATAKRRSSGSNDHGVRNAALAIGSSGVASSGVLHLLVECGGVLECVAVPIGELARRLTYAGVQASRTGDTGALRKDVADAVKDYIAAVGTITGLGWAQGHPCQQQR